MKAAATAGDRNPKQTGAFVTIQTEGMAMEMIL
jgi:hypothetical protein